jgi:hypothetical protein
MLMVQSPEQMFNELSARLIRRGCQPRQVMISMTCALQTLMLQQSVRVETYDGLVDQVMEILQSGLDVKDEEISS